MSFLLNSYRYKTDNGWTFDNISLVDSQDVSSQTAQPNGVFFKPDGLKFWVSSFSPANIYEYDLSVAWDLSTISYNTSFAAASTMQDLWFRSDGLKMYFVSTADRIYEYDLSVAWDLSTLSLVQNVLIHDLPTGIYFKDDGLKCYTCSLTTDLIYEYDLSVAWDISTISLNQTFDFSSFNTGGIGLTIKPDGSKMILGTFDGSPKQMFLFDLSTSWDISTISLESSYDTEAQGIYVSEDGFKMYLANNSSNTIEQYSL